MVPSVVNPVSNRDQQARTSSQVSQMSLSTAGQSMNRRQSGIGAYQTITHRVMTRSIMAHTSSTEIKSCRAELDSHADTCGVNDVALVIEYLGKVAEVSGFSKSMTALQDIPIVKAGLAYDDPRTGETIVLIVNQALYFGSNLAHVLLNQNQMRTHGLIVDDCPKHLSKNRISTHSITAEEHNLTIPLRLNGIISYFDVRTPTLEEINNCQHIEITSSEVEWEPYSTQFEENETTIESKDHAIMSLGLNYDDFHDRVMRNIASTKVSKTQLFVSAEDLAKRWMVGTKIAQDTIAASTQSLIRNSIHPIERRFKTKAATLRYNQLKCRFYSDTFFSKEKSVLNNTCGQLFVTNFGFTKFVPMKLKSEASLALQELIQDVGIPSHIHTDGAKEMTQGNWKKICNEFAIKMSQTEKASPWQNRTEIEIREMKKHVRRLMERGQSPSKLWDFCVNYASQLRNNIVRPLVHLHGRTPYELLTGNTPDISELLEFEWYQPIWYFEPSEFPHQNKLLGRWMGAAHRIGQALCYWILPESGVPIARTTIQAVSKEELTTDRFKQRLSEFDNNVQDKLYHGQDDTKGFSFYREDENENEIIEEELIEPESCAVELENIEEDVFDELLLTEPMLMREGQEERAQVIGRKRDSNGELVGH